METKKLDIGASCTWGDGPDVLVTLDGKALVCYEDPKNDPPPRGQWKHGYISKGSFDLTQAEARELAAQLLRAADACKELEDSLEEYNEKGTEETPQHEGVSTDKEGQDPAAAAKNLQEHLRKKLLHS